MPATDTISQAEETQCPPLMEVAHIHLYRQNAFRVTGLAVDATPKEISKHTDMLKMLEELGYGEHKDTSAFPMHPRPSVDQIREAIHRLKDPQHRLIDEFFWFWPQTYGESGKDEALQAYKNGDGARAYEIWDERKHDPNQRAVAYHNLAVLMHMLGLDWSYSYLDTPPDADSETLIQDYWTKAWRYWPRTYASDVIWDSFKNRIKSLNDPRVTTGFARRLEAGLPKCIGMISATLALELANRNRRDEAQRFAGYIRSSDIDNKEQSRIYLQVLESRRSRIVRDIKEADNNNRKGEERLKLARHIISQAAPLANLLDLFFPSNAHEKTELFDEMATVCNRCVISYVKESNDQETLVEVLGELLPYATSRQIRERIEENIRDGHSAIKGEVLEPLFKQITEITKSKEPPMQRLSSVKEKIMPQVMKWTESEGAHTPHIHDLYDMVAGALRSISVDSYNEHDDTDTALDAIMFAQKMARGKQMKELTLKDHQKLKELEAQEAKTRVQVKIRGDDIEINKSMFRLNERIFRTKDISGVRFGIYRDNSSTSFLVAVCRGRDEIIIECKRAFRSEAQANDDYQEILRGVFANIIPSVAVKIASHLLDGGTHMIGKSVLNAQGMTLFKSHLFSSSEHFVPYTEIKFGYNNGELFLNKASDRSICLQMPVRTTWNAVIFEQIMKAMSFLKQNK